jgi:hypothetical protein
MECNILLKLHGTAVDANIHLIVNGTKHSTFCFDNGLHKIKISLDDSAQDQCIQLIMTGKNHTHTKIDSNGNILSDVYATVESIEFNDIEVKEVFCKGNLCYEHNNNNQTDNILDQFYGFIGCNGTIFINFYTPINFWFIEHAYDALVH